VCHCSATATTMRSESRALHTEGTTIACRRGLTQDRPRNCFFTRDCDTNGAFLTRKCARYDTLDMPLADKISIIFSLSIERSVHSRFLSSYRGIISFVLVFIVRAHPILWWKRPYGINTPALARIYVMLISSNNVRQTRR